MERADLVALLAASWLGGASFWMLRSLRRGRALADTLATQHPDAYAEFGAPRPTYVQSVQRARWFRFVTRREYERLNDPGLVSQLEAYRRAERRGLLTIVVSLVIVSLVIWWLRHTA